jgi:AcrR family transcriptional regulator
MGGEARVGKRQERSFRTEERLAAAVIGELREAGLEGCTVPAVAQRAGVAVGTIYRRYANKDALIADAILNLVSLGEGARHGDYAALANEARDLRDCLSRIATAAAEIASENRTFLLAIRSFARTKADPAWRKKFQELQGLGRDAVVRAVMARFGPQIRGGEAALRLSLAALYGAVEVIWLEPQAGLFSKPPSRQEFIEGLTRMQVQFLLQSDD